MEKNEISQLRKQYPPDTYNISKKAGGLVIAKKKTMIWIRKRLLAQLPQGDSEALSQELIKKIEKYTLKKEYFAQSQVSVTIDVAKLIAEKAKLAGIRQIAYLTTILEYDKNEYKKFK